MAKRTRLLDKEKPKFTASLYTEIITNWWLALHPAPKVTTETTKKKGRKTPSPDDYLNNIRNSNFPIEEFEKLLSGANQGRYSISEMFNINAIFWGKTNKFFTDKERGCESN